MPAIAGVLETVLYAEDLDAAERFYGEALGLPLDSRKAGRVLLLPRRRRGCCCCSIPRPRAAIATVPPHGAIGAGHACFAVAESRARRLEAAARGTAVYAIEHEQTWPRGGRSFYVRDPAGNSIEFATPRIWGLPEPRPCRNDRGLARPRPKHARRAGGGGRAVPRSGAVIRLVADLVCPWCYIAFIRLQRTLAGSPALLIWHPFLLNPNLPAARRDADPVSGAQVRQRRPGAGRPSPGRAGRRP